MLKELVIFIGLGYLLVLAVLGHVTLLEVIKKAFSSKTIAKLITLVHFILGISAVILYPASYLYSYSGQNKEFGQLVFAAIVLIGLVAVFYSLSFINKNVNWK